jgi:hypothetical protein
MVSKILKKNEHNSALKSIIYHPHKNNSTFFDIIKLFDKAIPAAKLSYFFACSQDINNK